MTVLEKCGISKDDIEQVKEQGFFVPTHHQRFSKFKKSIGFPQLVFDWADSFTPPLSEKEKLHYIEIPEDFYQDAVLHGKMFRRIAGLMLQALGQMEILRDEERMAACLAILRIYYASFDYNFYKYDRHLEFHDYPDSPVGHFYLDLKQKCVNAAERRNDDDVDSSAQLLFLNLLTPTKPSLSIRYEYICRKIFSEIGQLMSQKDLPQADELEEKVERDYPSVKNELLSIAEEYFKSPREIIEDVISKGATAPPDITRGMETARRTYSEIRQVLSETEMKEVDSCLKALEWFAETQDAMAYLLNGKVGNEPVRDAEFKTFAVIKELIESHEGFVLGHQKEMNELFESDGLKAAVAPRIFVYNAEHYGYFQDSVNSLFIDELERWFPRKA